MKSLLLALLLLLGSINCYCQVLRVDGDPFEGNARPNAGLGFDNNNHQYARLIVTSNLSINKMDVRRGGVIVSAPKKEIGRMIIDFLPNYNAVITFYADQCPPLNIKIPDFVMGGWEYEMNILFDNEPTPPTSSRLPISFGGKTYGYMIQVPGGSFQMGSNDGNSNEKPPHTVSVNTFYIGETEVTQELWKAVMGDNPSNFKKGDNYPVEEVSWNDCQTFIKKLNEKTGKKFRLPTEAEWEFAARGGKSGGTKYSGSDNLAEVAWYGYWDDNDKNRTITTTTTMPVAQKKSNSLGIYDMLGNVWEWCQDWYASDYYKNSPSNNPQGPSSGSYRVLRGGSWNFNAYCCRVANRYYGGPGIRGYDYGLRLALVP